MEKNKCFDYLGIITLILCLWVNLACFWGGDPQEAVENDVNQNDVNQANEGDLNVEANDNDVLGAADMNAEEENIETGDNSDESGNLSLNQDENTLSLDNPESFNPLEEANVVVSDDSLSQEEVSSPVSDNMDSVASEVDLIESFDRGSSGLPAADGLPELGSKMPYVVKKGDTLSKIASQIFGDYEKWRHIAEFTGLKNPDLIYPGEVVYYQLLDASLEFSKNYVNQERLEVVVKKDDTLSKIAQKVYGCASCWKFVWRQNQNVTEPDVLEVGQKLYLVNDLSFVFSVGSEVEESEMMTKLKKKVVEQDVALRDMLPGSMSKASFESQFRGLEIVVL